MDCINSFIISFLRKKTFNLIWEKVSTFEVLCVDFIKEIFIWVCLIFCVRKSFVIEGVKISFFKIYLVRGHGECSLHLNRRSLSNFVRNKPVVNNFVEHASFPNLLCAFKQNSPFLHSILTEVFVYINLILP